MTWLEAVTVRPSRWRVRHNAVLVVETFSKQLTVTAGLLNILVEAALTDDDNDVRTAAIKLVSDLWKKPYAIDYDIAQEVKKTIISDSHKDTIQNEVYTDIREKWVLFLGEVAEYVTFSEAIPVIIQVAVARGSSSEFRSKAVALLVSESLTKGTFRACTNAMLSLKLHLKEPTIVRW
ncbi:hypothetical protein FA13DRAFT_12492 [Coprinellus micaceus]|uniref:CLASP N-terminal domain-containing protein n=1 Tax=Coprinellus micaceus TaxID=71717 RepID=A0A4Y7TZM1_COPMI|nr:hypothetical protein FA13DRAFT_12492 [Coprinellus micaceus]